MPPPAFPGGAPQGAAARTFRTPRRLAGRRGCRPLRSGTHTAQRADVADKAISAVDKALGAVDKKLEELDRWLSSGDKKE